jgi:hypothetical protein
MWPVSAAFAADTASVSSALFQMGSQSGCLFPLSNRSLPQGSERDSRL